MATGFIILFGLTMLYLAATSRIIAHIRILMVQGFLLFLICCCGVEHNNWLNFAFLTVETLIVKSIVIPWFLYKVSKKTHSNRDVAANIPHFYCLVIATLILLGGFLASNYYFSSMKLISPIYFGVSVATIIISLWLITIKHKIISNVIEFITMENGIFLLSLSVSKEMPMLVNMGVLLDVFIAVYILGLFVNEINKEFNDLEVSHLSDLKDYEYND
jgi:hydrogenase-4 component E